LRWRTFSFAPAFQYFSMAALEAATQRARVCGRIRVFSLADARLLGGRVKPGHGEEDYALFTSTALNGRRAEGSAGRSA
jgi:hypothetical protein